MLMFVTTRRTLVVLVALVALVVGFGVAPASAATQTLTVTVVDPRTGAPVTAYQTCIFATAVVAGAPGGRACTGTSGTAVLRVDDASDYIVSARTVPTGYLSGYYYGGTQDPSTATPVHAPATVTFALPVAATVTGTLTFPSGQGASGYTVTIQSTTASTNGAVTQTSVPDGGWSATGLPPGAYTVKFSGRTGDSWAYGQSSAATATVIDLVAGTTVVNDVLVPPAGGWPPSISVPTGALQVEATGPDGSVVDYADQTRALAADGGPADLTCSPASGSRFAFGLTTVVCTATDPASGATAQGQFSVEVRDTRGPQLTVSPPVSVVATGPNGAAVLFAAPVAVDAVDGPVPATCDHTSGAVFPVGITTVQCSATDSHGNTSADSFTVTVVPNQADLQVTVTAPATLGKHETGIWRLTVLNHGPAPAANVRAALITQGLTVISTSPATKTGRVQVGGLTISGPAWSIASLAAGASATFEVTATPTASRAGTLSVIGGAVSSIPDPVPADNIGRSSTTVTK